MRNLGFIGRLGVLGSSALPLAFALAPLAWADTRPALDPQGRDWLRSELQDRVNEAELLVRNQEADAADLARLEREHDQIKLLDRIPLEPSLAQLEAELRQAGARAGVALLRLQEPRSQPPREPRMPAEVESENDFEPTPGHVARPIELRLELEGERQAVLAWREAWSGRLVRWLEPVGQVRQLGPNRFEVPARAYAFRAEPYPRIRLGSVRPLLPAWARSQPRSFAVQEPELWSLVARYEELVPRALPFTENRRRFRRDQARLRFFYSRLRAVPRPGAQLRG